MRRSRTGGFRFRALPIVAVLALTLPVCSAGASTPGASRGRTHILISRAIPGFAGTVAQIVDAPARLLVVARETGTSRHIIWQHDVPRGNARLVAPGHKGVFGLVVRPPKTRAAHVCAFWFTGSRVRSAIGQNASGCALGDAGASFSRSRILVRAVDIHHAGSVKYRTVERYVWSRNAYVGPTTYDEPDYLKADYPHPSAWVKTSSGGTTLIRLEIADTEATREMGLMNRQNLDPDSGMIFIWSQPVLESFWMKDTLIPLSIAFLAANGQVQEIQEMAAMTADLHTPAKPYEFAIEANQRFFSSHGISTGDSFHLQLTP